MTSDAYSGICNYCGDYMSAADSAIATYKAKDGDIMSIPGYFHRRCCEAARAKYQAEPANELQCADCSAAGKCSRHTTSGADAFEWVKLPDDWDRSAMLPAGTRCKFQGRESSFPLCCPCTVGEDEQRTLLVQLPQGYRFAAGRVISDTEAGDPIDADFEDLPVTPDFEIKVTFVTTCAACEKVMDLRHDRDPTCSPECHQAARRQFRAEEAAERYKESEAVYRDVRANEELRAEATARAMTRVVASPPRIRIEHMRPLNPAILGRW